MQLRLLFWFGLLTGSLAAVTGAADRAPASAQGRYWVYFGTYTDGKSQGIYVAQLDTATGRLTEPKLAAAVNSPSFVALHPNGHFLYAVNEVNRFEGKKSGAVTAFSIDPQSGQLTELNQQLSGGEGPCHLNVDPSGQDVLVANYTGGSCEVLPLGKDGRLQPATAFMQHHGSSVNRQRQEGPHAHGIYLDAQNRFAFVPDLGQDKVMIYKFDPKQGSLVPNDPAYGVLPPGSGPRHMTFDPAGRHAYVINEMLCTVVAFHYDADRGSLTPFQTVSTLPAGESLLPSYSTAEIEMHPSGKFVYGSNRGHDTIAVFRVNEADGELRLIQNQSTLGKIPRGFGVDPSGQYLVAGNQDSDNAAVFRIDQASGMLQPTGQVVQVGKPVCVKYLPAR